MPSLSTVHGGYSIIEVRLSSQYKTVVSSVCQIGRLEHISGLLFDNLLLLAHFTNLTFWVVSWSREVGLSGGMQVEGLTCPELDLLSTTHNAGQRFHNC